jgi:predicted membrane protein (TIGR00267 family)
MKMSTLRRVFESEDFSPIIRRFFTNTIFDSTFTLLGIVVGAAFTANVNLKVIMITMATSSLALGISAGISVYEAESLESERKIMELERALFMNLKGTRIERKERAAIALAALIVFLTPLFSCAVAMLPFIFAASGILEVNLAPWASVMLALGTLFGAGAYMGRLGRKSPWKRGLRMVCFGLLAFIIGLLLNSLV